MLPLDDPSAIFAMDERTLIVADTQTIWRIGLKRLREAAADLVQAQRYFAMQYFFRAKEKLVSVYTVFPDESIRLKIVKCDKQIRRQGKPTLNNKDYRVNTEADM